MFNDDSMFWKQRVNKERLSKQRFLDLWAHRHPNFRETEEYMEYMEYPNLYFDEPWNEEGALGMNSPTQNRTSPALAYTMNYDLAPVARRPPPPAGDYIDYIHNGAGTPVIYESDSPDQSPLDQSPLPGTVPEQFTYIEEGDSESEEEISPSHVYYPEDVYRSDSRISERRYEISPRPRSRGSERESARNSARNTGSYILRTNGEPMEARRTISRSASTPTIRTRSTPQPRDAQGRPMSANGRPSSASRRPRTPKYTQSPLTRLSEERVSTPQNYSLSRYSPSPHRPNSALSVRPSSRAGYELPSHALAGGLRSSSSGGSRRSTRASRLRDRAQRSRPNSGYGSGSASPGQSKLYMRGSGVKGQSRAQSQGSERSNGSRVSFAR